MPDTETLDVTYNVSEVSLTDGHYVLVSPVWAVGDKTTTCKVCGVRVEVRNDSLARPSMFSWIIPFSARENLVALEKRSGWRHDCVHEG